MNGSERIVHLNTFRHSVATLLRSIGVDVKVAQEFLRHTTPRLTLELYTQVVTDQKRAASDQLMNLLLQGYENAQHLSTQAVLERLTTLVG